MLIYSLKFVTIMHQSWCERAITLYTVGVVRPIRLAMCRQKKGS